MTVDVAAGDGTRVRASASMAANVTLEDLDAQIGELEELVAAEVDAWIAQARAEDALFGDAGGGDGGGAPPAGAPAPRRKRTAATLARRRDARARLEAAGQARRQEAEGERAERITRLEARAAGSRSRRRAGGRCRGPDGAGLPAPGGGQGPARVGPQARRPRPG